MDDQEYQDTINDAYKDTDIPIIHGRAELEAHDARIRAEFAQESEAEWYRAIEIGMIEQEKLDDYRHAQELEVLRVNLKELNRLLHATGETRRENLNMACRLARWRDLLLAERDKSRTESNPCTGCVHVDDNTEPENCLQCIRMTREDFYTIKEEPK